MRILLYTLSLLLLKQTLVSSYNASLGEAVRGTGKAVYIIKSGLRHHVTDWNYFLSLGFSPQDIHHYSDSILESYPLGDPISPPQVEKSEQKTVTIPLPSFQTQPCPCRSSSSHNIFDEEKLLNLTSKVHVICLIKNLAADSILSNSRHNNSSFNYKFISIDDAELVNKFPKDNESFPFAARECDALISLSMNMTLNDTEKMERRCPGTCKPFPFIEIPIQYLTPPFDLSQTISCSMTIGTALTHGGLVARHSSSSTNNFNTSIPSGRSVDNILHSIARRRMEECLERGLWPMGSFSHHNDSNNLHSQKHIKYSNSSYLLPHKSRFPRRKVYGLIIWIGI